MKPALRLLLATSWLLGASALLGASPRSAASPPGPLASPQDIHDIHGPVWIPQWWRPWLFGGLAVASAGAVAGLGSWLARRRRRPLTPGEQALRRLEAAESLAAAGQSRLYAEAASNAVRKYLEDNFGLTATHQTTEEFFADLCERQPLPLQPHAEELNQFLGACDLAKFSLVSLQRRDLTSLHQLARQFVITTARPDPTSPRTP